MDIDVAEARTLYEEAIEAEHENRTQAEIDLRFRALEGQWDERLRAQRTIEGRPCFTFDRTGQIVRQIVGDIRLNPPSIKVRPQDGGSDPALAETLTGLIRNIESVSQADAHYIAVADAAVTCGMGFLRVRYDYVDDQAFDMDFRIESIPSPFAAVWDPGAVLPCREDGDFWFVTDLWTEKAFKRRWPKASTDGWDGKQMAGWREGDFVRVAEYWHKKPVTRHLLFLADGRTVDATDLEDDEIRNLAQAALAANPQATSGVLRERRAQSHKVCMTLMNGVEQLEETAYWPGKYIPIAPVWGEEIRVGDKVVRRGVIRPARDAQIRYNVQATAVTEAVAMAPKPKWLVTPAMIANHEKYWATAHLNNYAFLPFTPDPEAGTIPQRVQPEPPPAGLLADIQGAAMDIEATTGVYRENLGKETNAISGKAILSRQREGDVGTYLYADNLALGVQHVGRILVDALPRVYDTERSVRVLGEDGETEFVTLNQRDPMTGRLVNDISAGRYDVVSSVGPAFSTRREEARESMLAFIQAYPAAAQIIGDLFAKAQDWPGNDEVSKRLRKQAIAMGVDEPEEGDPPPPPPQPDPNMVLAQAEMAKAQAAMVKAQADAQKSQAEAQVKLAELAIEAERLRIEAAKANLEAADTASEIRTRAAKVAQDGARLRLDAADKAMAAADRRVDRALGERRADRNEMMTERRDMRAAQRGNRGAR
jgi:hypothetical protein